MQDFGFINEEDYKIFNNVIQNIKEIKLKDFQFKVTNKILVTNSFLHKINKIIEVDSTCVNIVIASLKQYIIS